MLSIIIPVYNVEKYLDKCFMSINRQTLNDYEVIVVNDGSTDNSYEICKKYTDKDSKYKLFSKKNGGLMSAWMFGVQQAKGDYFGFVDSDDYVAPEMFEKLYSKAIEYNCDIVMCDRYDVVQGKLNHITSCIEAGLYYGDRMELIYQKTLPKFYGEHITNARWNKVFRRDVFLHATRYCSSLSRICEDRFITPPCMFYAKSFYYINEPMYYYVLRTSSNHSMPSPKLQAVMKLLYDTQTQMIADYGMEDKYKSNVDRACLNYLYLVILRNFAGKGDNKIRRQLAKDLLDDDELRKQIRRYKADLTGKLGWAIRIVFFINNSYLFVWLFEKIHQD